MTVIIVYLVNINSHNMSVRSTTIVLWYEIYMINTVSDNRCTAPINIVDENLTAGVPDVEDITQYLRW